MQLSNQYQRLSHLVGMRYPLNLTLEHHYESSSNSFYRRAASITCLAGWNARLRYSSQRFSTDQDRAAYFDNASSHPLSVHSAAALHRYIDWVTHEVGEPWWPPWAAPRDESKRLFAKLINAQPEDIAFARSAVEAESNLINGMQEHLAGGNIVTHDLHYGASLYNYKMREQASAPSTIRDGEILRIVKHRNWRIDYRDMEQAIDSNTRLVSITLVSNVNGYLSDVKAISDLAHAHGAYLYVDIIQGVGAVPVDVQAMGIDFAACSTFKWLMGVKGFGFLYVRSDLQGTVVKPTQHCGGLSFNYPPWVEEPDSMLAEYTFTPTPGPSCYEVSYPSYEGAICAQESLKYILRLGVDNIRNHVRTLTDRLMEELPPSAIRYHAQGERKPYCNFCGGGSCGDSGKTQERWRSCRNAARGQDAYLPFCFQ